MILISTRIRLLKLIPDKFGYCRIEAFSNRASALSAKVKKAIEQVEENNNPIIGFFKECEDEELD